MKDQRVLLDANILLRLLDPWQAQHLVAMRALRQLGMMEAQMLTVPQSFYELWVVATRPLTNNGMGLTPAACQQWIDRLVVQFPLLDDTPALFSEWLTLVRVHNCSGKVAHDARYVAAMQTHSITRLLTFNTTDFSRYPAITVLDPHTLALSHGP